MNENFHVLPDKLRWLIIGVFILVTAMIAILFLVPAPETNAKVDTSTAYITTTNSYDSPNAISNGIAMGVDEFNATIASTNRMISNSGQSVAPALYRGDRSIINGLHTTALYVGHGLHSSVSTVGHSLNTSATFIARTANSGVSFMTYIPRTILSFTTDTAIVSAVIKPDNNMPVPTIDTSLPVTIVAQAALPVAQTVSKVTILPIETDSTPAWPLHGVITTLFGVPELPYQAIHTGLDISDGNRSGTTPIKPFKPGHVINVVRSGSGLGNHVIIDHGEGITSVYGHLYSISVDIGQTVDKTTVLGFEGSTGASTGAHLHFEIRVNGQPMDPYKFIDGQP